MILMTWLARERDQERAEEDAERTAKYKEVGGGGDEMVNAFQNKINMNLFKRVFAVKPPLKLGS